MKTIIHVNQHVIRKNNKLGTNDPVITCKTYKANTYTNQAEIFHDGKLVAKVIYRPDNPLSCGAKVWIETECEVVTE